MKLAGLGVVTWMPAAPTSVPARAAPATTGLRAATAIMATSTLLVIAPGPCFALWEIADVSKERAKEMGMDVRSKPAGPADVRVELEFKAEGELKDFSHVDLRFGDGHG